MKPRVLAVAFAAALFAWRTAAAAEEWIASPSYFTHDANGQRVAQHTPIGPFYTSVREDFQRSGYRHTRSSLQFGGSVDHYHVVEEWGRPVRPYDEWRFPYRPYSVPYGAWGPPFAGVNFGYPGFPFGWGAPPAGGLPPGGPPPAAPAGGAPPGGPNPGNPAGGAPPVPPFNPNPPGMVPGGGNPYQPFVPYRGFQPWFDDRYPAFDDRAPWRREPFPAVPPIP